MVSWSIDWRDVATVERGAHGVAPEAGRLIGHVATQGYDYSTSILARSRGPDYPTTIFTRSETPWGPEAVVMATYGSLYLPPGQ